VKKIVSKILDLFFPVRCINCQRKGEAFLCIDCLSLIVLLENDRCPFCHSKNISRKGEVCFSCKKLYFLDGLIAAASLEDPIIKKAVHLFKYPPFVKKLSKPLAFLIITQFNLINNKSAFSDFILSPLPLSKKRRFFRGFNQAEELAKEIAKRLNLPLLNLLVKTKETQSQIKLSKEKRRENVLNAFEITKGREKFIKGKKVILVDDVFTTGATLNEAAKILKEKGAKEVWGMVVAREF
jgi:competence protein ComFC